MNSQILSKDGSMHVTDERINTSTHLAAACFALLGGVLLIVRASVLGDAWKIVGFSVYAVSLLALFTFSVLHHGVEGSERTNKVLRTFDYLSIFLLIAGTVTPIVLVLERNIIGWSVLGVVWAIAALGISLRAALPHLPKYITDTLYIVLGWLPVALVAAGIHLSPGALTLLVAGGVIYSSGFVLFVTERPNPIPGVFGFHEIWHILVVLAALCHYLLMYFYVLPQ